MTTPIEVPYRGELLLTQLAAYGLAGVLDSAGHEAFIRHDPMSLGYDVSVTTDADALRVADAVMSSATRLEDPVEQDLDPGKSGNNRRPSFWPRASFANDPTRAQTACTQQSTILDALGEACDGHSVAVLLGLGMSGAWLPEKVGPSKGATELDGVLGNHTSDFVRGVLRRSRSAVAGLSADELGDRLTGNVEGDEQDRTGWAPPGTSIDPVFQWLAALGLAAFPVAHQSQTPSVTPGTWRRRQPSRRGVTLPLFSAPTSYARARAIVNLEALAAVSQGDDPTARARLRAFGITEVLEFVAQYKPGAGSSVAFSFSTAQRVDV